MNKPLLTCIMLLAALEMVSVVAHAQAVESPKRGQLLYTTHCIACHNSEMHWRDARQAKDWEGLKDQVRRWQAAAKLEWSEADITEVADHLNSTIYRYPRPADHASLNALPR